MTVEESRFSGQCHAAGKKLKERIVLREQLRAKAVPARVTESDKIR
jgi:hypothetical protein